jgi:hypothetical protein
MEQQIEVYHLIAVFEAGKGHFCHSVLLVRCLLRGEERGISGQREVDTREAVRGKNLTDQNAARKKSVAHGTRLVWNSFKSTLREPSKRSEAVMDETTCAINLFKFVKLG